VKYIWVISLIVLFSCKDQDIPKDQDAEVSETSFNQQVDSCFIGEFRLHKIESRNIQYEGNQKRYSDILKVFSPDTSFFTFQENNKIQIDNKDVGEWKLEDGKIEFNVHDVVSSSIPFSSKFKLICGNGIHIVLVESLYDEYGKHLKEVRYLLLKKVIINLD
jgi:hypothetical protein